MHVAFYRACNLNVFLFPLPDYIICVYTFCNHQQKQFLSCLPSDLQANNFNLWSWESPFPQINPQEST